MQVSIFHPRQKLKINEKAAPFADLHIDISGKRFDPIVSDLRARFFIPAGARNIVLKSFTARPIDISDSGDTRNLGICLERITIDDGFRSTHIALDDPLLMIGFHDVEEGPRRWTSGRTPLANNLFATYSHGFFLILVLAGEPLA